MLIAGIRKNRFATFVGVDTDLTCVHMTTLNCLVRNANTFIIHGNGLALTAMVGFAVHRTPLGGELHRLTQAQAQQVIQAPYLRTNAEPSPTAQPVIAQANRDQPLPTFTKNTKGQFGFDF